MKKKLIHTILVSVIVFAYCFNTSAQTAHYADLKEKIYIQTSHVFFKTGETMFFKIYVVKAKDQKASLLSKIVYVELINPSGNILQKLNFAVVNGYAEGSIDFTTEAVGGVYKIRAYTTWMRNENEESFFSKEITLQKLTSPRILMKLEFPEKGHGPGSEVKANFSMRNLSDQPIKNYPASFAVLIGGNRIQTETFKTNNEGKAVVKFTLPIDLKSNDGLLNITISYDSYTEAISRSIPIVLNKIDLQFMPEGGTLVEDLNTSLAFKAVDEYGKPADVKGEIYDDKGNKITTFESYHFGMGKFFFLPQKGRTYKAKITSPTSVTRQYDLPIATQSGMIMNLGKADNRILIRLASTEEREVKLAGQTKGINYYSRSLNLKKGENNFEIDEKIFPAGIAQFTLVTPDNLPLAERLIFLNETIHLNVAISTNKQKYLPREKVILTIKTADENGKPVPSNFSLTVMDDKLWSLADDKQDHIFSWLLLSSELKGKIEEPQFYFKKDEPKALPALDLLMLTDGYRYFDYIEYVQKEKSLKYSPDQENILSGIIVNSESKPIAADVFLIEPSTGGKGLKVKTSENGEFFFSQLKLNTNYYLFAQALNKKDRVFIKITQKGTGYSSLGLQNIKLPGIERENLFFQNIPMTAPVQLAVNKQKQNNALILDNVAMVGLRTSNLDEVVVVGYGAQKKKYMTSSITVLAANELAAVNNVGFALQGKVAGLSVIQKANPGAAADIRIRGSRSLFDASQPLFVVNGIPLEGFNHNTVSANDIESITVLKDAAAAALYGARGMNGVILIETKKFRNEKLRFQLDNKYYYASDQVQFSGPPPTVAKRFYAPEYYSLEAPERNDFRETIYWNPTIQTDKNGEATVEFYNSDANTTIRAIAEGVGYNGKLGRAETTYITKTAMTVDVKIPPYLTVGDKALLPLVLKNNASSDQNISIEMQLPQNLKVENYDKEVVLMPDSSKVISIPVEAMAAVEDTIKFVVTSQFTMETISLPISASQKGFPVIETFSGNTSKQHQFRINKMVPGSLSANLKLYKNLEGQLLDGIESMLREPYGCFEQTSSTTYPNVYVLKYLKESGKSNKEIEKKAMDYLQRGYNRLTGFETAQDGFEWFGHTPPHEALTAYGLLEFTDMQEFVDVDKQMLERTKKFLLGRRDGNGSFKIASGGYDRFAAVPNKIANIYIVYALSQAGLGNEIQLEYQTAVKKALENNDSYQLSMMALAASNIKNEANYRQLITALNTKYQKTGLTAETSVVNSRDASLRVETMSLYALALMRESSPKIGIIAELITKILAEKNYYGYGSTQATVLALKAIVEYSKLIGSIVENTDINFAANGQEINEGNTITKNLREGENNFTVTYTTEKNIPYNLQVSYYTFTPPNSDKAELTLSTQLNNTNARIGETLRMDIEVSNKKGNLQPMAIAKIGIPAGLSAQPWQLKDIIEKNKAAYYEIFDNYLVFYWMGFAANETKKISLDLKTEVAGTYKGKASNVYLYYTPEHKNWNDGLEVLIVQK